MRWLTGSQSISAVCKDEGPAPQEIFSYLRPITGCFKEVDPFSKQRISQWQCITVIQKFTNGLMNYQVVVNQISR